MTSDELNGSREAAQPKKKGFFSKFSKETEEPEYEMAELTAEEQAARDTASSEVREKREYRLPSNASQIFSVYKLQMKLYVKNRTMFLIMFIMAFIPILAFTGTAKGVLNFFGMFPSTSYLLILMPLMIIVIPAMLCGRLLSTEFKERTVYLNFPLPMSRMGFFMGKFLAGLTICIGVFALAIGFAAIAGDMMYDPTYPNDLLGSLVVCFAGVMGMASVAYGLGPYFKRGSVALTIVLMLMVPLILLFAFIIMGDNGTISSEMSDSITDAMKVLPTFASYQSLWLIDNGVGGPFAEIFGMHRLAGDEYASFVYLIVSVIWSAAFLALGALRVKNKEL